MTEESADEWLNGEHRQVSSGLSGFLDVEAGLREARLHDRHTDLLRGLGDVLDVEAGLRAVTGVWRPSAATDVWTIAADRRLAYRRAPGVVSCVLGDLLARALALVRVRRRGLAGGDPDWKFEQDVDRAVAMGFIDRRSGGVFDAVAEAYEENIDLSRRDVLVIAKRLAFQLGRSGQVLPDADRDLAESLARNINRAIPLRTGYPYHRLTDQDLDLAIGVADLLARTHADSVARLLGLPDPDGLAAAILAGALDDFTEADLGDVDLTDVDLTGIQWSDTGTRWPPGTDMVALRGKSRELEPGSGVYVIRAAPPTGKDHRVTSPR
ncbi:hypothetical protein [Streptomyces cylindrosporus]|uniref:Uncharacterized protein n=1 Tax=Streptomyces cylindrosporus TaxID=2927583 RepID=A0ABS9YRZ9_9ACTN|nr:hypothetical protein [Streptomyces cylindrosporus]MCI3278941.1 hypothetical protein [Streptomyces cylindrosporus]